MTRFTSLLSGILILGVSFASDTRAGLINDILLTRSVEERGKLFRSGILESNMSCDSVVGYMYNGEKNNHDWYSIKCSGDEEYQLRMHFTDHKKFKFVSCKDFANLPIACWTVWNR